MTLSPAQITNIGIKSLKCVSLMCVVGFMLLDVNIHRESINDYKLTFSSVPFKGEHFFCTVPEARAILVTDVDIVEALNLPPNSSFSDRLRIFGQCRAKAKQVKEDDAQCMCHADPTVITFVLMAFLFLIISIAQMFAGPPKDVSRCTVAMRLLVIAAWLTTVVAVSIYQTLCLDDDIYINEYRQRYFQSISSRWTSIGFGYLFVVLCFGEYFFLNQIVEGAADLSLRLLKSLEWMNPIGRTRLERKIERCIQLRKLNEPRFEAVLVSVHTWP